MPLQIQSKTGLECNLTIEQQKDITLICGRNNTCIRCSDLQKLEKEEQAIEKILNKAGKFANTAIEVAYYSLNLFLKDVLKGQDILELETQLLKTRLLSKQILAKIDGTLLGE